jgi:hypothetical protein
MTTTDQSTRTILLEAVGSLGPMMRAGADQAERDRRLPQSLFLAMAEAPSQSGLLFAGPPITILNVGIPAVALGIARGAIDALVDLAGVTIRKGSTGLLREHPSVQADVARAKPLVRSGRAFLYESIEEIWAAVLTGDKVSVKQRALARIAFTNVGTSATPEVDLMRNTAASTAMYTSSPLAGASRDIHTLTQHFACRH